MKIAVFFPNTSVCGWSAAWGIGATLRRMGHAVLDVPMPTEREAGPGQVEQVKQSLPKIEAFKDAGLLLVSGVEHIAPWIDEVYGKYEWKQLSGVKACWLQESCRRDDYNIDFEAISWWGDEYFFPAIQDAEFHDQEMFAKGRSHWLAFGVDTNIFKPNAGYASNWDVWPKQAKLYDVGFMGLLYGKRQVFLNALRRHNIPPIRCGSVHIQDMGGYQFEESARRYAENIRQIKVFLNMPALSRLIVSKVYEVLACGTFCLTPTLPDEQSTHLNMRHFESKRHLVYYSPSNLPMLAQYLREYSSPEFDKKREEIAAWGCKEVHEKHSLKIRLEEMFSAMKLSQGSGTVKELHASH